MFRKWQSIALWKRVLIGLFAGLAIGLTMRYGLGVERATQIADVGFKPVALPVTRDYLADEGLSVKFIDYMATWPGFVED